MAAMTDPRLDALIAKWRKEATELDGTTDAMDIPRRVTLRVCSNQLSAALAALTEPEPAPAYTIEIEREDTGDKKEGGCAAYSSTVVGALAELCATLLKVDEDKSVEARSALTARSDQQKDENTKS